MDLKNNPGSALCAPLRLQDTDSDKPTVTPSYSSDFRQNCSRPHIQKEKKELTIRLLQLIHNKSARLFWHCSWSDLMIVMKMWTTKRTRVFSGNSWSSIKSWQQVGARQTEAESCSGQMKGKQEKQKYWSNLNWRKTPKYWTIILILPESCFALMEEK